MLPDVVVVSRTLQPATAEAVAALEDRLGTAMPDGYAETVTAFGSGTFCNELNVLAPDKALERLDDTRERWAEHWFWDDDLVTQGEMVDAVLVGDSANGDELAFHPGRGLFFLPRDDERVQPVGPSYVDALTWFCTSSELVEPSAVLWFESWAEQSCFENWSGGGFDDARAAVAELSLHVAEDHVAGSRTSTFLVPMMGGHVRIAAFDAEQDLYVHVRYLPDLTGPAERMAEALESVGVSRQSRWGAEPVG